jgi:hypothetical protein
MHPDLLAVLHILQDGDALGASGSRPVLSQSLGPAVSHVSARPNPRVDGNDFNSAAIRLGCSAYLFSFVLALFLQEARAHEQFQIGKDRD